MPVDSAALIAAKQAADAALAAAETAVAADYEAALAAYRTDPDDPQARDAYAQAAATLRTHRTATKQHRAGVAVIGARVKGN